MRRLGELECSVALSVYKGDVLLQVIDEPITFPLQFHGHDSRSYGLALSIARRSRELPANEEISRFSVFTACNWYVYDPFDRDRYFSWIFPQLVRQSLIHDDPIHFNLTDIQEYHDTTLRELHFLVGHSAAVAATTFYEWSGATYAGVDCKACRSKISHLLGAILDGPSCTGLNDRPPAT
jgi:hypothetical protein